MDVIFELGGSEFEWDENKARSNEEKHGVSFKTACQVFFDDLARFGDASVDHKQRDFIPGCTYKHYLLLTVYVERGNHRSRIISARPASGAEKRRYYESEWD